MRGTLGTPTRHERGKGPLNCLSSAELQPAISANPYVAFHFRATVSGAVTVRWEIDGTVVAERTETIEVVP